MKGATHSVDAISESIGLAARSGLELDLKACTAPPMGNKGAVGFAGGHGPEILAFIALHVDRQSAAGTFELTVTPGGQRRPNDTAREVLAAHDATLRRGR
jgi:hypothetical protein